MSAGERDVYMAFPTAAAESTSGLVQMESRR